MKIKVLQALILCSFLLLTCACSHKSLNQLVGNDRDEHGCISSAGYKWSYAKNDCIRIWEVGERFDSDQKSVFLVFSPDSTFAEIFPEHEPKSILCKRKKKTNQWLPKKGDEFVSIANSVITVHVNNFDYTKSTKK